MSLMGSSLTLFPVDNTTLGAYGPLGGGAKMEEVDFWEQSLGCIIPGHFLSHVLLPSQP